MIVIAFDIDTDAWGKVPAVNKCFPLLVRVFDGDGNYPTRFTTSEVFTASESVFEVHNGVHERVTEGFARGGQKPPQGKAPKPVLLKDKKTIFRYSMNKGDLRDAAAIEVGFYDPLSR